jgi:hypothetical protein
VGDTILAAKEGGGRRAMAAGAKPQCGMSFQEGRELHILSHLVENACPGWRRMHCDSMSFHNTYAYPFTSPVELRLEVDRWRLENHIHKLRNKITSSEVLMKQMVKVAICVYSSKDPVEKLLKKSTFTLTMGSRI